MAETNWAELYSPTFVGPGGALVAGAGGFVIAGPVGLTFRNANSGGDNFGKLIGNVTSGGADYAIDPLVTFDVREWRGRIEYKNVPVTASGDFGCETERRVCLKFEVSMNLLFDVDILPELGLHHGSGVQAWLKIGDSDLTYPNDAAQRFYYTPRMLLRTNELVNQAKGLVAQQMRGKGSGIFLLPDEQLALTTYLQYLQSAGWDGR